MTREDRLALRVIALETRLRDREREVSRVLESIQRIPPMISTMPQRQATGQYVCLVLNGDRYECVGIIDEDTEELPEFSVIMSIPTPESMPEWDGF